MKTIVFEFEGEQYAVHHGAIYFWHGSHVSNMPYAAVRSTGIEPYMKSLGQKPLSDAEKIEFSKRISQSRESK